MSNIRNFDAEFCGKVPLHQTNMIQPHGVLLVVKKDDLSILQASENAAEIFSVDAQTLVTQTLPDVVTATDVDALTSLFKGNVAGKLPFMFTANGQRYLSAVEQEELYYFFEIEKEPHDEKAETSFVAIYHRIKRAMAAIAATGTTAETCRVAARELKKISGFDKVMVYYFDEGWNGTVVAEEMEEGMESYLDLKFPASDIPKPARDLYKKSPFRLIPTIDYEPVRIFPVINPATGAFTNLTNSNLRSVAAVHIEYLRNMQVNASMSTRILKDGELWGLIACHHRTPKYLSYEMCSVFELLSDVISNKISAVLNRDSFQYKAGKQEQQQKLVENVLSAGSLLQEKAALQALLDADGVAIVAGHHIDTGGRTPSREQIEDLVYWLQANEVSSTYQQTSLPSVFEAAESYAATGSGLLALPIEMQKGDYILAFRSEAVQNISWGGNPNEALRFESDGKKYHPRESFQIWKQTVKQTSTPWKKETLEVAESLRNFLIESKLNQKKLR